ncbi:class A beta-lactamase-related serine hydrolase [Halieaceae bacterium IMCC14734]|uniref:Class A beta-lactamase-related serine hydrolase n=1 Tax=Candidatus Litorirhabdus singularis TaxID=2518993 RepID=A0ABT3TIA6_9GAMM|nr:serine hydrolase [Candidatus Litorirhabdus singularis]MCX2981945.1 class A beta-lactamase-related serine hydrolase [Candidatus Litorirhabdus singularis]
MQSLKSVAPALVRTVCLLLLASWATASDLKTGKAAHEGVSAERLQRINKHMQQAVADGVMVGGQGMIARNGKIIYNEVYGLSDREDNSPMRKDTMHRIYSMTKPVTAVALMMLYEEGKFFLDDPVARYLPELADLQLALSSADADGGYVSDGTEIQQGSAGDNSRVGQTRAPLRQPTIRDLLRHTAGLTYGIFGESEVDKLYREAELFEAPTIEEFVQRLGKLPLQYEPGRRWHYSIAVDVQGRLIEALSGMRFGEFLQQRIFTPLAMADTSFVVPVEKWPRVATLYAPEGGAWGAAGPVVGGSGLVPADPRTDVNYKVGATFESGGAGLISTADDYMRFSMMLLNGGELNGVRLLSPKTVELMTTNHLREVAMPSAMGGGMGFGLGFAVALDLGAMSQTGSVGEFSWGGAAGTRFWIDPQEQLIGIFMVQSLPHQTRLAREFKVLTYQALVD